MKLRNISCHKTTWKLFRHPIFFGACRPWWIGFSSPGLSQNLYTCRSSKTLSFTASDLTVLYSYPDITVSVAISCQKYTSGCIGYVFYFYSLLTSGQCRIFRDIVDLSVVNHITGTCHLRAFLVQVWLIRQPVQFASLPNVWFAKDNT